MCVDCCVFVGVLWFSRGCCVWFFPFLLKTHEKTNNNQKKNHDKTTKFDREARLLCRICCVCALFGCCLVIFWVFCFFKLSLGFFVFNDNPDDQIPLESLEEEARPICRIMFFVVFGNLQKSRGGE
jgi:hypothetical protein